MGFHVMTDEKEGNCKHTTRLAEHTYTYHHSNKAPHLYYRHQTYKSKQMIQKCTRPNLNLGLQPRKGAVEGLHRFEIRNLRGPKYLPTHDHRYACLLRYVVRGVVVFGSEEVYV